MTAYRLSPAAAADLDAIWDYTAGNWGVARANHYTDDISRHAANWLTAAVLAA